MTQKSLQTQAMYTQLYKDSLQKLFKYNMQNKSNKELCEIIDNLHNQNQLWKLVCTQMKSQKTKKTNIQTIKVQYNSFYRQALHSERLNEADCKYLEQYLERSDLKISAIVEKLMESYFKDRDIFPYEVSRKLHQIEQLLQKKRQEEKKNLIRQKNLEEQQNKQEALLSKQQSIKNGELISNSNQTSESENQQQLSIYNSNEQQQCDTTDKYHQNMQLSQLQQDQQNDILGMSLKQMDKHYIQALVHNNRNKSVSQITEELIETYFQNANIFISDIEIYVMSLLQKFKPMKLSQSTKQLHTSDNINQTDSFINSDLKLQELQLSESVPQYSNDISEYSSSFYDYSELSSISLSSEDNRIQINRKDFLSQLLTSLEYILGQQFEVTKAELCKKVNSLSKTEAEALWNHFHSEFQENSKEQLRYYYTNSLDNSTIQNRYKFTKEDLSTITTCVKNTTSKSVSCIAKFLQRKHFSNKYIPQYLLIRKVENELAKKNLNNQ
ncbi:Hypothetical_protein [Hexamita inflata]|uniref:Hypothetical_protein n=1 Tax=Hexamita inflata TaxID=28002 RepID=A0AA86QGC4_9EUKA|nr:Hypothetical protein HINF_LOCUS40299 [Hexamita inflata]